MLANTRTMRGTSGLLGLLTLLPGTSGKIDFLGVAIPGIDFGCDIDGSCPKDTKTFPLTSLGGGDGQGQMEHFVKNDSMNVFRLPTSWQYITDGQGGDELDSTKFGNYDKLVQACLKTGAYCMLDLHNFARYDDGIIGQGGPTNDVFASLWSKIAKQYADDERVIFGLMNEPHDLDIQIWAKTCQAAVTAIRKAGAKSHIILLPGTNFASAETFVSSGSAEALAAISNPDGSKDGLILDTHKYLDINNSGTHSECTTDNVKAFETIGNWLRKNKRKAIISETGASMDDSCMEKFCTQNEYINDNSDVFIGFVSWGAGSFPLTYVLTLTPTGSAGSYTDNKLMTQCVLAPFMKDSANNTESETTKSAATKSQSSATETAASVVLSTEGSVFKAAASTDLQAPSQTQAPSNKSPEDKSESSHSKGALMGLTAATVLLFHMGLQFL